MKAQRDLTTGPIGSTLIAFALPTLGSNILQSLNGSINAIWIGRFLGERALAAASNANIIMFLMFGGVFGFGMAATILIGQAWGRRDVENARRAFGSAIGLVLAASLVFAVLGWACSHAILVALATPPAALPLADAYLRVIFLGLPAAMVLVLLMMGLRGTGDSMTPLWFMILAVVIDTGLNPLLIRGIGPFPQMGIAGSATATLIANAVSVLALTGWIMWRDLPLRLKGGEIAYLRPQGALVRTIVGKGLPIGAQMLVISAAGLAMVGLVNREGVETTAAYGVVLQLWAYIQMPALAIGAAVSAMAAQNIGAGKWDRVARITRAGILYNIVMTGVLIVAILWFDRTTLGLFLPAASPAVPIAQHIGLIASWSFLLFGVTMVLFGTVRANGAVWGPLIVLFVAMFPVRLGFALAIRPLLGADALWWSFPLGSAVTTLGAWLYYRYGPWRRQRPLMPGAARPPRMEAAAEAPAP
ncbi:MATE family efflux transporter [Sphingomonas metalli]|uniref:MATE family efflux transporter n=1 Tax=Sphingomonas metalli TaxID=1779358 RepID=A0A916SRM6_9SPHN|nr:MATE family efflux transporter [Sphingomonas metalli]GGB14687.1 MATE family efflux transporter [Sphingomonas metalli]